MREIDQFIDKSKESFLRDLRQLIQIPSFRTQGEEGTPYGKECARVLDAALAIAKDKGFCVKNYEGYMGTVDFFKKEPELGILCHLDVVPAGEGWSVDPYDLTVQGDTILGRGVIDDKGPAVAALYAMYAILKLGIPLKRGVRLYLGCDEENGSSDLAYFRRQEEMPPMVFTPDAEYPLINVEKGMLRIRIAAEADKRVIQQVSGGRTINAVPAKAQAVLEGIAAQEVERTAQQRGIHCDVQEEKGTLTVTAHGKSAHASTPELGENALCVLLELLSMLPSVTGEEKKLLRALTELFPRGETNGKGAGLAMKDDVSGALTLVFSVMDWKDGGLSATMDIRFPADKTKAQVIAALRQRLDQFGISISDVMGQEPHQVSADSEFVQTLLKVYQEKTGKEGYCRAIGGGTYVHEIPGGVAFGAMFEGEENNMHGADECASIQNLLLNAKIFAHAILELCG